MQISLYSLDQCNTFMTNGILTMKPRSSSRTQWNEQYCRGRPGIAEITPHVPHSSCWLERSIHICAFLGFLSGTFRGCVVWETFWFRYFTTYLQTEKSTGYTLTQQFFHCARIFIIHKGTLSEPECNQTHAVVPLRPFRGQCSSMKEPAATNGEKKIGFFEFYPSLGSMQCLNYLLHLSINVPLSVYCPH